MAQAALLLEHATEGSPVAVRGEAPAPAGTLEEEDAVEETRLEVHLAMRAEVNIHADLADLAEAASTAESEGSAGPAKMQRSKDSFYMKVPFAIEPMHINRVLSILNKCCSRKRMSKDRTTRISMNEALSKELLLSPLAIRSSAAVLRASPQVGDVGADAVLSANVAAGCIGLGSDVAFLFHSTVSGRESVRFWIGNVHRMVRRAPGSKQQLVTDSIPLASIKDGSCANVFVQCYWYKPCSEDYRTCTEYSFIKDAVELAAVSATTALCDVLDLSLGAALMPHTHELAHAELERINAMFVETASSLHVDPEPTLSHPSRKRHSVARGKQGPSTKRGRSSASRARR